MSGATNLSDIKSSETALIFIITGYRSTRVRNTLFIVLTVLTVGLFRLLNFWKPKWLFRFRYKQCSLKTATIVAVTNEFDELQLCRVEEIDVDEKIIGKKSRDEDAFDIRLSRMISENELDDDSDRIETKQFRIFTYNGIRLIFNDDAGEYSVLSGLDGRYSCKELTTCIGLTLAEQQNRRLIFGHNAIDVRVPSYRSLFTREVLNPFYIFQILSLVLWFVDDYYIYAVCVCLISTLTIALEIYETRVLVSLRDLVKAANESSIVVKRKSGELHRINGKELTPGDVIVIPNDVNADLTMPCDVLLVAGSCTVNESIITGESVPVAKSAVGADQNDETFEVETHLKHVVLCGSKVIQARSGHNGRVCGVVVRTGFSTTKGGLIRDVLYPKPVDFAFYRDAMLFLVIFAFIAIGGTAYSLAIFIRRGMNLKSTLTSSFDIVTIVVSPALPAAMTVGVWYAQRRLKTKQIFSVSPQRINLCGKLNLICFDKTGTLTETGLDIHGVIPSHSGRFGAIICDPSSLPYEALLICMTTCHNLVMINGRLAGDELDLKVFESTKWRLDEQRQPDLSFDSLIPTVVRPAYSERELPIDDLLNFLPFEIGIIRQFPFSAVLQRCTVVVRRLGAFPMEVYCKGAPEQIARLCRPETIPADFDELVDRETIVGYRVLALAGRSLSKKILWHHIQRMKREVLECEMEFLGLIVFKNRTKGPTAAVINQLRTAAIRCVMATGDNLRTALCVARQCHLINFTENLFIIDAIPQTDGSIELAFQSEMSGKDRFVYRDISSSDYELLDGAKFALTGKTFALIIEHFPDILRMVVFHGVVFARMLPRQKGELVEIFQKFGYIVGMCGDGANDCSALKVAHAGISLSDSEASIAAPFTTRIQTIECVPELIREGRCALVTSFGIFKYMIAYSMIQFASVLTLYTYNMFLADYMFLFIDLFIITIITIAMSRNEPHSGLIPQRPFTSLLSFRTISSLIAHILVLFGVQAVALIYLKTRVWFGTVYPDPNDELSFSWETTTLFFISCYQYLIMAFVFSEGRPYRKPFYTNHLFVICLLLFTAGLTILLFLPVQFIDRLLELVPPVHGLWRYQLTLVLLAVTNLVLCLLVEAVLCNGSREWST